MGIRAALQVKRLVEARAHRKRSRQDQQQRQQTRQRRFPHGSKAKWSSFRLHLYASNEAHERLLRKPHQP